MIDCEVFSALVETDGLDTIVLRLSTSIGPVTLRLPLERARRLLHVLETGLKAAEEATAGHDVVYLSMVETVKKAYATKAGNPEAEQIYMFVETNETGAHNFVMDDDTAAALTDSIDRASGKGPSTH